jgi:uncharacterized delta-60 repeat protein
MFVTNQSYPYIPTLNNELFLDAGLPASYPLSGNLWIDMTGNQNNGTLVNGVTHDLNLKGSLVFNGTNQYVTFSSPVDIPVANSNYTINAWFNTDTLANRGIIGWGDYSTTNQSNYIKLTNTGISNSWTNNDLSFNTVIPTGQWQNVIAKYDGTTRELWLNGVMVAQDTPVGHNVTNANNLTIGLTNTNEYFDGKLSLVQVFNRALTSEEIQDSFLNFKTRYDGTDTEICITPVYCTPSPTRTPTQTPPPTKTPTETPTQTPSQTPTSPKGECWSVTEQYGNYSYVSYIDRYGNQACETVGPYSTVTLCIFPNSENAIQGYEEPLCTGNGVDYYEQDLMSECYEFCAPPTPTPTETPPVTPTPTPTKDCVGCGEFKSGTYSGEDFYTYPPTYLCDLGRFTDICYTATDSVNPGGGEIDTNNGSYGTTTTTIYASNFNFNNTVNYTTKYSALLVGDELKVTIGSTNYFFLVTSIVNNTSHQTIGVSLISATGPNQTPTFATTVCVYFESNESDEYQISWDEIDRPNRFTIYNSVGQVANTGWVGFATYSGPWGDSLNNPGPGSLGFLYNPLFKPYYVIVDAGPADPSNPINDAYNFNVICSAPPPPPCLIKGFDNAVNIIVPINGGNELICGGYFESYNDVPAGRINSLTSDGLTFNFFNTREGFPAFPAQAAVFDIKTVIVMGLFLKVIVVGIFDSYKGSPYNNIIRLNIDGTIDTTFNVGTGFNGSCFSVEIQSDGKILVGGGFTSYNGVNIGKGIARLNSDGTLDTTFNSGTGISSPASISSTIHSIGIQTDGKILCTGGFFSYNGIARRNVCRLNIDGSIDTTFNPGTGLNSIVGGSSNPGQVIKQLSNGDIMIGGNLTSYNGIPLKGAVRVSSTGVYDPTFEFKYYGNPFLNGVNDFIVTSNGKYLFVGSFYEYDGGVGNDGIVMTNTDGSLYNSFNVGVGIDNFGGYGAISVIELQTNGNFVVGGLFTKYNNVEVRENIVVISPDGSLVDPCIPPSPTPTPTPTSPKYTVTIYASLEDIPNFPVGNYPVEQAARVYNTQGPNNVLLGGNIRSVSCNFLKTITNITPGTIISLGMLGWSSNRPIEYDIFLGDLCSGTKLTFGCGTALDHGGGSSITVNSNMTISIIAKVSSKSGGAKSFTYCLPL